MSFQVANLDLLRATSSINSAPRLFATQPN